MEQQLDFGILLGQAYIAFVDELRAHLASSGFEELNRSFGYVARALATESLSLRELAEHLGITSQGALKIVDDMEENQYLERLPDRDDGRAKRLRLTKRGRAALAAARTFHARFEADLTKRVGAQQARALRAALTELVRHRELEGAPVVLRPM
jgi:DNA-binding MarR family transcriptional regulator